MTPSSVQVTLAGRLNCFPQEISWSPTLQQLSRDPDPQEISWSPNPQQLSQGPDPQEISRDPNLSTWEWTLFGNCSLQMSHWGPWSLGCCPFARGDLATQTHRGVRVTTRQGLDGAGRGRKRPEASLLLDCGLQSVGGRAPRRLWPPAALGETQPPHPRPAPRDVPSSRPPPGRLPAGQCWT